MIEWMPQSLEVVYRSDRTYREKVEWKGEPGISTGNFDIALERAGSAWKILVTCGRSCYVSEIVIGGSVVSRTDREDLVFLKNGFQSWSYSGARGYRDRQKKPYLDFIVALHENTANPPTGIRGHFQSEMFFFLGDRTSGEGMMMGQLPGFDQYLMFDFSFGEREHLLNVRWDINRSYGAEESIVLDPLSVRTGSAGALLDQYAEGIRKEMKVTFNDRVRAGWCSWYYYYTKITYEEILANLEFSRANAIPFDVFQIDDGYQNTVGDWLNQKIGFSGNMRSLSNKIRAAGYMPGLWLAPFIITPRSPHFKNQGWVLRDEAGKPVKAGFNPLWGGSFYALDITHPGVKEYVKEVFKTVKYTWGFDYLKLDFMYAASLPGARYERNVTRAGVLKNGMKLIRDTVGGDTFLLGCGMPLSAAIGFVDAMRVSCDVAPYWKMNLRDRLVRSDSGLETRGAIRNSIVRSFMDKRWWINDPDCLMLRRKNTKLTRDEMESLFHAIMVLGGLLVVSDRMMDYSRDELDDLFRAIKIFKETSAHRAFPADILEGEIPEIVLNEGGYLSVFNFSDRKKMKGFFREALKKSFGGEKLTLKDMSSDETLTLSAQNELSLRPHQSRFFRVEKG